MSKGFTLLELMVVLLIVAALLALWLPRAERLQDWLETERAVRDVTTALAVGRHGAVMHSTRARIEIAADTLRIDRLEPDGWQPWWRLPRPSSHRGAPQGSKPNLTIGPPRMGWGAANTKNL